VRGRGAADTTFAVFVQDAGIYPIRTIWQEGGGDANIELFSVKTDGTKVLINDTDNGGLKSYRTGVAPSKTTPGLSIAIQRVGAEVEITWTPATAALQLSNNLVNWATVPAAVSPYRTAVGANPAFYRAKP